jgi:hypothetical protein
VVAPAARASLTATARMLRVAASQVNTHMAPRAGADVITAWSAIWVVSSASALAPRPVGVVSVSETKGTPGRPGKPET